MARRYHEHGMQQIYDFILVRKVTLFYDLSYFLYFSLYVNIYIRVLFQAKLLDV